VEERQVELNVAQRPIPRLGSALLLLPVLFVATCGLFTACGRDGTSTAKREPSLEPADLEQIERRLRAGEEIRVVNFWATWCQPCVEELPDLIALAAAQKPRGVEVIGISLDLSVPGDSAAVAMKVRDFLHERGIGYENLLYTGSVPGLLEALDLPGTLPTTLVIGRDGQVLWRHEGRTTRARIEEALEQARTSLERLAPTGTAAAGRARAASHA
jgi:thiol-disulfide isomerase/thioredoxin